LMASRMALKRFSTSNQNWASMAQMITVMVQPRIRRSQSGPLDGTSG
jgi:hypothetical protein